MKKRVLDFVKKIDEAKPILVVTHEGCLRSILSEVLKVASSSHQCDTNPNEVIILDQGAQKVDVLR